MIPEAVPTLEDQVCSWCTRWMISFDLGARIARASRELPFKLEIISGYRTREHQLELRRQGRPAADPDISTHCSCPATGADLLPNVAVTRAVKAQFGAAMIRAGLRWGGGSPVDDAGIPSDWNHVDLGPRRDR